MHRHAEAMNQKKDKATIYNSRAWHELRTAKLRAQPLCERCLKEHGWIVSARCVHHIIPIETARTTEEMWRLALCDMSGLQSLCYKCHSDIHKAMRSRSREGHMRAVEAAQERRREHLLRRFAQPADPSDPAAPI